MAVGHNALDAHGFAVQNRFKGFLRLPLGQRPAEVAAVQQYFSS